MLLKSCTQYASKFRKLNSGHRTEKGQFSFKSQRAMLENVSTNVQLYSFHIQARLCSKSFKLVFNSKWTENFQMYKLDLEKAEKPEIKLPTITGSWRKQESSRKTSIFADHNKLWKILKEMGIPHHLTCLLGNLYAGQEATVRTVHGTADWFHIGKEVRQRCILSPCSLTSMQSTSWETLDWKKHKLKSRLPGEISITSGMQTPPLWQKVKRN